MEEECAYISVGYIDSGKKQKRRKRKICFKPLFNTFFTHPSKYFLLFYFVFAIIILDREKKLSGVSEPLLYTSLVFYDDKNFQL